MSESIAVTRARIARRIYLALYDANHNGVSLVSGEDFVPGVLILEDPILVREVIQRLRDSGVVRERDSAHPRIAVLAPEAWGRMEMPIAPPLTVVERFRRDLTALDRGDANVVEDFLNLESMVRTGHTHTRGL